MLWRIDSFLKLFTLKSSRSLGQQIATALAMPISASEERIFEDGERKIRPLENVDGSRCVILHSLHAGDGESANDKLCGLLFFIGALKDAGAARVTVVAPYLCYARKDRRTKLYDPVTTRYVASLFEALGTDCVMTCDVHNPAAFENAFRLRTVSLTASSLFLTEIQKLGQNEKLCVVSPDPGGVKRAELFRQHLEASLGVPVSKGIVDKHRSAGVLTGDLFAGETAGATALVIDDMISTGHTMVRAAKAAKAAGACRVIALATHGLLNSTSLEVLADPAIDMILLTDSVIPMSLSGSVVNKIRILSIAGLLADAIHRTDTGLPMADLLAL
jgi:ribose-phosphate pyrophosphokinase